MTTPARREVDAALTEKQFQGLVTDLARTLKWRVYHTFDARRSEPGFPDLVLIRRPRVVFAELKSEKGKTSPQQDWWLDELKNCGKEVWLWKPSMIDEIKAILL